MQARELAWTNRQAAFQDHWTETPVEALRTFSEKLRYGRRTRSLLDRLNKIGLRIQPFYIIEEGIFEDSPQHWQDTMPGCEVSLLGPEDMKEMATFFRVPQEKLVARLEEGNKCFGLRSHGKLVAISWCDLGKFRHHNVFPLEEDEAYLYDAYTLRTIRGRDIAPYLRFKTYQELRKLGCTRCYSYTDYFNKAAMKFKLKLNARVILLRLEITLAGKWSCIRTIRKYDFPEDHPLHNRIKRGFALRKVCKESNAGESLYTT